MLRFALPMAGVILAFGTAPSFASAACYAPGPAIDFRSSFSFGFGNHGYDQDWGFSEQDQNRLDLQRLRRLGVNAVSVERWGGCLRAYVREPGGGERMELYNPRTFERVY